MRGFVVVGDIMVVGAGYGADGGEGISKAKGNPHAHTKLPHSNNPTNETETENKYTTRTTGKEAVRVKVK